MARLDNPQRLKAEDFPEDDQETISILAPVYNHFVEQVTDLFNGRIDYENTTKKFATFEVTVGANGVPLGNDKLLSQINSPIGINVVRAINLTNSAIFPTSHPFISYSPQGNGIIQINHVSGLPVGSKFRLNLEII